MDPRAPVVSEAEPTTTGRLERRIRSLVGSAAEARWIVEAGTAGGIVEAGTAGGTVEAGTAGGIVEAGTAGGIGGSSESPGTGGRTLSPDAVSRCLTLARRRRAGEPLQYVLGSWAFRRLELKMDRRALIARPETEQVTEVALSELRRMVTDSAPRLPVRRSPLVVADLGTGSGAIALSLAVEVPAHWPVGIWAIDDDPGALELARENLSLLAGAGRAGVERVTVAAGSWRGRLPGALRGRTDLIVANPPYVAAAEWDELDPVITAHEPRHALVAEDGTEGTPGLAEVEAVLRGATGWLARRGSVVVEMAPGQTAPAFRLAEGLGFDCRVAPDLSGRPRALVARRGW